MNDIIEERLRLFDGEEIFSRQKNVDIHCNDVTRPVGVEFHEILLKFVHAQAKADFPLINREIVTFRILVAVFEDLVQHSIQLSTLVSLRASFGFELRLFGLIDRPTDAMHFGGFFFLSYRQGI